MGTLLLDAAIHERLVHYRLMKQVHASRARHVASTITGNTVRARLGCFMFL